MHPDSPAAWLKSPVGLDVHRDEAVLNEADTVVSPAAAVDDDAQAGPPIHRRRASARHAATGSIEIDDPELLGTAFLSMVVSGPATGAMWGYVLEPDVLEERIRVFVRLFLDGVRPRT